MGRIVTNVDGIPKHVLQRVFWCSAQSVHTFKHCHTLYKGVFMIVVGMDLDNQLVPLAFVLAMGENDNS